jgi:hypothetical protein
MYSSPIRYCDGEDRDLPPAARKFVAPGEEGGGARARRRSTGNDWPLEARGCLGKAGGRRRLLPRALPLYGRRRLQIPRGRWPSAALGEVLVLVEFLPLFSLLLRAPHARARR